MNYYEAPCDYYLDFMMDVGLGYNKCIFLAGSISKAADWQAWMSEQLKETCHVFNPRRAGKSKENIDELEQIRWEFNALNFCPSILFWFSNETVAPITLFEYGAFLEKAVAGKKKIFVGIHPEYPRLNDVVIQTQLRSLPIQRRIVFSLNDLAEQVIEHFA